MTFKLSEWQGIGASACILRWITHGFPLHFETIPTKCELPNRVLSRPRESFVDEEVFTLLRRGSIQEIMRRDAHCILPLSVVAKKGRKYRLVLDSHHTNQFIACPSFKQEGVDALAAQIEEQDTLISIDLECGFHHLTLVPLERKYLCFAWRNRYFQWVVLPFGVKSAPYLFSKMVKQVINFFRERQTRCTVWVDDFIFMIHRDTNAQFYVQWILSIFARLGWSVNQDKCDLQCSTSTQFIGYNVSSVGQQGPWLQIPSKRIKNLRNHLRVALAASSVSARFLARIAGKCISMTRAVLLAKLLLRNLYRCLATKRDWSSVIYLDESCRNDLKWWFHALHSWNGAPLLRPPVDLHLQIETDTSNSGWGAWMGHSNLCSGPWEKEVSFEHSNFKELLAVYRTLQTLESQVKNKAVQILSDNVMTVAYLNQLSEHNRLMLELSRTIFAWCSQRNVTLSARHLSGTRNQRADALSRILYRHEWQLHKGIFNYIDHLFGPHQVDRFVSETTALLPRYNSMFRDRFSEGVDAFAQNWGQDHNWWNPPFGLIHRVLTKACLDKATGTIIAPLWTGAWFPKLLTLSVAPPIRLPQQRLCTRLAGCPEVLKNPHWTLCAWKISGRKDF